MPWRVQWRRRQRPTRIVDPSRLQGFEGRVFAANPSRAPTRIPSVRHHRNRRNRRSQERKCRRLPASPRIATYKSPGGAAIFSYKTGSTLGLADTAIASGQQRRESTAHGANSVGPFGLLAEYIYSQQRWASTMTTLAWATKGGPPKRRRYSCTAATRLTRKPRCATPFDLQAGTFGAFEWSRGPRS